MSVRFFGLLHLAPTEVSAINVTTKTFSEQVIIYVNNAKLLAKSLEAVGIEFSLLTNDREAIKKVCGDFRGLQIEEITFETRVPSGIKFYSAHFKLDAFKYISNMGLQYAALCDLDMVCVQRTIPLALRKAIENQVPLVYEISDQVIPAYGHDVIIRDMELITNEWSDGRWIGGEFVAGPPSFFSLLANEIDGLWGSYLKHLNVTHHVGDEAYLSCAIQKLRRKRYVVQDAGLVGVVGRYWNASVRHQQKPFEYYKKNCFLLHLPADKKFLADYGKLALSAWDVREFIARYEKMKTFLWIKRFMRGLLVAVRAKTLL